MSHQRTDRFPKLVIAASTLAALLSVSTNAPAVDAVLTDDAFVDFNNPAVNFGASQHIVNDPSQFQGLLKFDLSTLPAGTVGSDVAKANLRLWVNTIVGSGEFYVSPALDPWDEATVTAATTPTLAVALASPTVTEADAFVVVDVSTFVRDWLDGVTDNNGFIIEIPSNVPLSMRLDSKENRQTAHEPRLEILLN